MSTDSDRINFWQADCPRDRRSSPAIVQFPGGYIAEIHSVVIQLINLASKNTLDQLDKKYGLDCDQLKGYFANVARAVRQANFTDLFAKFLPRFYAPVVIIATNACVD